MNYFRRCHIYALDRFNFHDLHLGRIWWIKLNTAFYTYCWTGRNVAVKAFDLGFLRRNNVRIAVKHRFNGININDILSTIIECQVVIVNIYRIIYSRSSNISCSPDKYQTFHRQWAARKRTYTEPYNDTHKKKQWTMQKPFVYHCIIWTESLKKVYGFANINFCNDKNKRYIFTQYSNGSVCSQNMKTGWYSTIMRRWW